MSIYESLLNSEVALYTRVPSTNALGEITYSWKYSASGIKCRLVPITAEKLMDLPGEFQDVRYFAYFLSTQAISTDDRIKYNGDEYLIRDVYLDSDNYTKKALLRKL